MAIINLRKYFQFLYIFNRFEEIMSTFMGNQLICKNFPDFCILLIYQRMFCQFLHIIDWFQKTSLIFAHCRFIRESSAHFYVLLITFTHHKLRVFYKSLSYPSVFLMTNVIIYCLLMYCINNPIIYKNVKKCGTYKSSKKQFEQYFEFLLRICTES